MRVYNSVIETQHTKRNEMTKFQKIAIIAKEHGEKYGAEAAHDYYRSQRAMLSGKKTHQSALDYAMLAQGLRIGKALTDNPCAN